MTGLSSQLADPSRIANFAPGPCSVINATTDSSRVAIGGNGTDFQFYNAGTNEAFVNVGDGTVVAVAAPGTTDVAGGNITVPPGAIVIYNFGAKVLAAVEAGSAVNVAAVTATGGALLRISQGQGS
jgi:hypothetical protein